MDNGKIGGHDSSSAPKIKPDCESQKTPPDLSRTYYQISCELIGIILRIIAKIINEGFNALRLNKSFSPFAQKTAKSLILYIMMHPRPPPCTLPNHISLLLVMTTETQLTTQRSSSWAINDPLPPPLNPHWTMPGSRNASPAPIGKAFNLLWGRDCGLWVVLSKDSWVQVELKLRPWLLPLFTILTWAHQAQVGPWAAIPVYWEERERAHTVEHWLEPTAQILRRSRRKAPRLKWCCHSDLFPPLVTVVHKDSSFDLHIHGQALREFQDCLYWRLNCRKKQLNKITVLSVIICVLKFGLYNFEFKTITLSVSQSSM